MRKILVLSVIPIFLLGCSKNWCHEKYPIPEKDSISFIEIANIDTLYIPMPADTNFLEIPAECPDQKIIYKDGKIEYKVIVKDKILTITKISKADSVKFIYDYTNTKEFKEQTKVKEVSVIEYKVPKWCYYLIGVVIVLIGWVTRRFWLKFIKFTI